MRVQNTLILSALVAVMGVVAQESSLTGDIPPAISPADGGASSTLPTSGEGDYTDDGVPAATATDANATTAPDAAAATDPAAIGASSAVSGDTSATAILGSGVSSAITDSLTATSSGGDAGLLPSVGVIPSDGSTNATTTDVAPETGSADLQLRLAAEFLIAPAFAMLGAVGAGLALFA